MNTSDQSLFPMDTAFRRRWGLRYHGVQPHSELQTRVRLHSADKEGVLWRDLAPRLNRAIVAHTRTDDKQMGPYFIQASATEDLVSDVEFRSKVLFFLWSEVFRDAPEKVFRAGIDTYDELLRRYGAGQPVFADAVLPTQPDADEDE